jgi:hypothetical protein
MKNVCINGNETIGVETPPSGLYFDLPIVRTSSSNYTEVKAMMLVGVSGTVNVNFSLSVNAGGNTIDTAFAQIYVNGVAAGIEHSTMNTYRKPLQITDTITVKPGDRISIYAKSVNGYEGCVSNFTISTTSSISSLFEALTDCNILFVMTPSNATIIDNSIAANVDYETSDITVAVRTSLGATWALYSNSECTEEIEYGDMTLNVGDNTAYIKVISQSGTVSSIYTLIVSRSAESA